MVLIYCGFTPLIMNVLVVLSGSLAGTDARSGATARFATRCMCAFFFKIGESLCDIFFCV